MDELIREINGIKEQLGWSDDAALEAPTVTKALMNLCDLTVAVLRASQTVPDHQHRLQDGGTYRTGAVIPHGY